MKVDWVPYSASALVAGATALAVGSVLMPTTAGDSSQALRIVEQHDARWLAVAVLYFGAAVALTVGLPVVLTLLETRGARIGLVATGVFAIGCIGTAGYAVLLVLVRALVLTDSIGAGAFDDLIHDVGLETFLFGWIAAFLMGELLLALALWRARTVPRWIPLVLVAHVATVPLGSLVPEQLGVWAVLLLTLALAGIGISANNRYQSLPR